MPKYKVLGVQDAMEWRKYFELIPNESKDVYFKPEYYQLYEERGDGKVQCFIFEDEGSVAIYPYLINPISPLGYNLDMEYYDIQGAYGYNGVITNNESEEFLSSFFSLFDEFCAENKIVAEFLRINPLLRNPLEKRQNFSLIHDRENVYLNLLSDSIFETDFAYSTRKNVRKAIRNGLSFKYFTGNNLNETQLESFLAIYNDTMRRNNADAYYYFNTKFFRKIGKQLREKALFVFVVYEGTYISCELVLLGNSIAYSFLGGTLNDYYHLRPNDFLKYNVINTLKEIGLTFLLLGGGPDGVLRYKKTFSVNGSIPFFIGKKIHLKEQYDYIVKQWELKNPKKAEPLRNIILKYRF